MTSVLLGSELAHNYFILTTLAAVGITYWVASLPAGTATFTPSQFQETEQKSGAPVEVTGGMDPFQTTSQPGLDVAEENGSVGNIWFGCRWCSSTSSKEAMSIGSNGIRTQAAIDLAYKRGATGSPNKTPVLQSTKTSDESF